LREVNRQGNENWGGRKKKTTSIHRKKGKKRRNIIHCSTGNPEKKGEERSGRNRENQLIQKNESLLRSRGKLEEREEGSSANLLVQGGGRLWEKEVLGGIKLGEKRTHAQKMGDSRRRQKDNLNEVGS